MSTKPPDWRDIEYEARREVVEMQGMGPKQPSQTCAERAAHEVETFRVGNKGTTTMRIGTYLLDRVLPECATRLRERGVKSIAFPWRGRWTDDAGRAMLKQLPTKREEFGRVDFDDDLMLADVIQAQNDYDPATHLPYFSVDREEHNSLDNIDNSVEVGLRMADAGGFMRLINYELLGSPITAAIWGAVRVNRGDCAAPPLRCEVLGSLGGHLDITSYLRTDADLDPWLPANLANAVEVADGRPILVWVDRRYRKTMAWMPDRTFRRVLQTIRAIVPQADLCVYDDGKYALGISQEAWEAGIEHTVQLVDLFLNPDDPTSSKVEP